MPVSIQTRPFVDFRQLVGHLAHLRQMQIGIKVKRTKRTRSLRVVFLI